MIAEDVEATHRVAGALARSLVAALAGGEVSSVLLSLDGPLGAGKTEWVRGFMAALGRAEEVSSPTFAIAQEYPGDPPVRHLDLYRLSSLADLEAIGYRELFYAPGIALVEWMDKVPEARPADSIQIELAILPTDAREIRIHTAHDGLARRVRAVLAGSV